jgi:phasin
MTKKTNDTLPNFDKIFDFAKTNLGGMDFTKIEWPAPLKDMAEKSVAQAKEALNQVKAAQVDAGEQMQENMQKAQEATHAWNQKTLEVARDNANQAFDFVQGLMGSKSLSEAVELQTQYIRAQAENLNVQAKELSEMAKKVAGEAQEEIKAQADKALNKFK